MKEVVQYVITVELEHSGELIDPTDAVDISLTSIDDSVKIKGWKAEREF
jgi:hypothetical protein